MKKVEDLLNAIQHVAKKLRELKAQEVENKNLRDFSLSNFRYIEEIGNMGNPTFMELTKRLGLSKPTVTLMVARLHEKGFVEKTKSSTDGRIYYLSLTEKSKKIIDDYNKIYKKFIEQVASKYNDSELDVLVALLNRM